MKPQKFNNNPKNRDFIVINLNSYHQSQLIADSSDLHKIITKECNDNIYYDEDISINEAKQEEFRNFIVELLKIIITT